MKKYDNGRIIMFDKNNNTPLRVVNTTGRRSFRLPNKINRFIELSYVIINK